MLSHVAPCFALLLVLIGAPSDAAAQYNLRVLPSAPRAGSPFEIAFDADECEDFLLGEPGLPPSITVQDQFLLVAVDRTPIIDCSFDARTYTLPIEALPAGSYTLQLYGRIWLTPDSGAPLQTIAFQVGPPSNAAPITIPADGAVWMLLLGAGLMVTAWRTRREKTAMLSRAAMCSALSLALMGGSEEAMAHYNLRTVPSAPSAGLPFEIAFDDDECENFLLQHPGQPPEVTIQGQSILVAVDLADIVDCSSAAWTYTLPIEALPAGSYTLELYGRAWLSPGSGASLQTIAFQVVGAPSNTASATIPADGTAWMLLLGAGLTISAWRTCRKWK